MLHAARLIVADLTHERPNVYFELGYARGLSKTVITIAEELTVVHFDVKDWTHVTYSKMQTLKRDLQKRFKFEVDRSAKPTHPWEGRTPTPPPFRKFAP